MQKIEVVENAAFTQAFNSTETRPDASLDGYRRLPREHRTRVTVLTRAGARYTALARLPLGATGDP